jgi:hypothetical protein
MGWFGKKSDLLSDRARALNQQIAALEAEIQELDACLQRDSTQPRLRSTALPRSARILFDVDQQPQAPRPTGLSAQEPIFEEVAQEALEPGREPTASPGSSAELGVRKNQLTGWFDRLRNQFRGPATTNPKLVSYLAAGGIHGLRPLRYEKRVARNRFIALVVVLLLVLLGLIAAFLHGR